MKLAIKIHSVSKKGKVNHKALELADCLVGSPIKVDNDSGGDWLACILKDFNNPFMDYGCDRMETITLEVDTLVACPWMLHKYRIDTVDSLGDTWSLSGPDDEFARRVFLLIDRSTEKVTPNLDFIKKIDGVEVVEI